MRALHLLQKLTIFESLQPLGDRQIAHCHIIVRTKNSKKLKKSIKIREKFRKGRKKKFRKKLKIPKSVVDQKNTRNHNENEKKIF